MKKTIFPFVIFLGWLNCLLIAQPDPQLSLPWPAGEAWWLHYGPHHNSNFYINDDGEFDSENGCDNTNQTWSSLDFAPGPNSSAEVVASRSGWVVKDNCTTTGSFVKVVLNHGDGWLTGYYHLTQIPADIRNPGSNGKWVNRGEFLGFASRNICCDANADANGDPTGNTCAGGADIAHVHFSVRYDPNYSSNGFNQNRHVDIDGYYIGGWLVNEGNCNRGGSLTRGSYTTTRPRNWPATTFDPASSILNDGSISTLPGNDSYTIDQDITGGANLYALTTGTVTLNSAFTIGNYLGAGEDNQEGVNLTHLASRFRLLPNFQTDGIGTVKLLVSNINALQTPIVSNTVVESNRHSNLGFHKQIRDTDEVLIFPNPAKKQVTIQVFDSNEAFEKSIQLINLQGQVVKNQIMKNSTLTFNVDSFSPGYYFIRITGNVGQTQVRKLIISN